MKQNKWLEALVFCGLSGCQAHDTPLERFILQVEQQTAVLSDEPVQPKQFVVITYMPQGGRSPFMLPYRTMPQLPADTGVTCWQPEGLGSVEPLEHIALDSLQFKGVMGPHNALSGLIQTPDGFLHKVSPGQYLGLNHGRIDRVFSDALLIQESLPDGNGCWVPHHSRLILKENRDGDK